MQPSPHNDRPAIPLQGHILTFVGAFASPPRVLAKLRKHSDWRPWSLSDALKDPKACDWMRAQSVPTFHTLMFATDDHPEVERFERQWREDDPTAVHVTAPAWGEPVAFRLVAARVYAFGKKMGHMALFAVEVRLVDPSPTLGMLTALGAQLRDFANGVTDPSGTRKTVEDLLERVILPGVEVKRQDDPALDPLDAPKLKTFIAADLASEQPAETLRELLYDVASLVNPGSAGGTTPSSPTDHYLETLVAPAVRPFKNWQTVTFVDTFATVGHGFLARGRSSWTESYLAIYIYNLYVKFRCNQLTADIYDTASRDRDAAVLFLSRFALERVSVNFLPSLFHDDIRRGLELKRELKALNRHIASLSRLVEEDGQTRQNALLALVSVFGAAEGIPAILDAVPQVEDAVGLHGAIFWFVLVVALLAVGALVFWFLFPGHARHLTRSVRTVVRRRRLRKARQTQVSGT